MSRFDFKKYLHAAAYALIIIVPAVILVLLRPDQVEFTPGSIEATSTENAAGSGNAVSASKYPIRKWSVAEPEISAEGAYVYSLDSGFVYYSLNSRNAWYAASITKLLSAFVVTEEIGATARVTITDRAVNSYGVAGGLKTGEIYLAEDLLKIMLLASSNDAAVAFEDYVGGQAKFTEYMNGKAQAIGLLDSVFVDAAGLSDLNLMSPADVRVLMQHILKTRPEIIGWTRLVDFAVQPLSGINSRVITNINILAQRSKFLGGKTGTSEKALQNLSAIFSSNTERLVVILLGSNNRVRDTDTLLKWVNDAYTR